MMKYMLRVKKKAMKLYLSVGTTKNLKNSSEKK